MPQAIVDPEQVRRFARTLERFTTELQERASGLRAQLAELGKTWRDQEHRKFLEEFEQHMKVMGRFVEMADQHIPYLMRKAEIIEEYLRQK